jgi:hypothetical protein
MELVITGFTKSSFSLVSIRHGTEEELTFSAKGYSTAKPGAMKEDDTSETGVRVELFEEINEFLQKLTKDQQDTMYEIYYRIDEIFSQFGTTEMSAEGVSSSKLLAELLSEQVARIYEIVKFEDLREFVVFSRKFKIPADLMDSYATADKVTPRYMQRTYLRNEYIDLVAVALGLRLMIPVWGRYLPISGKEDRISMKELNAYKLLAKSSIYRAQGIISPDSRWFGDVLDDEEPNLSVFARLETYLAANLKEEEYELAVSFKHLSSDEVPEYLMAQGLIRKAAVAPLSPEHDKQHMMKIIFNYCCSNNNRKPSVFGSNIKPKVDAETALDDNSSVLCVYKMKEQVSAGDLMISQKYVMRYINAAQTIEPNLSKERIEMCVSSTMAIDRFIPTEAQTTLCIWIMSTVIAGCIVEVYDRKEPLLVSMGIAQAVLWEWGLPQLAILLTAKKIELADGEMLMGVTRLPVSNANIQTLQAISPYDYTDSKGSDVTLAVNTAVRGIDMVANEFIKNEWEPRCCKELAASYYRSDKTKRIEVSPDFRDQCAQLLIKLNDFSR